VVLDVSVSAAFEAQPGIMRSEMAKKGRAKRDRASFMGGVSSSEKGESKGEDERSLACAQKPATRPGQKKGLDPLALAMSHARHPMA
jgi:hypothetical protein